MMLRRTWLVPVLAVFALGAANPPVSLVQAVKEGDMPALQKALRGSPDVNVAEPDGATALHWAAHRNNVEAVDLLIRSGASAKTANRYGVTPLSLAAENGNAAIIERLLQAGANPNAALLGGETPVMTASRGGHAAAVKALVAKGADVNARETTRGQSALMWAAAEGHTATIQALVAAGADVHAKATGPGALRDAKADPNTSGLLLFLGVRGSRLDAFTPLMFAARGGHSSAASALIDAGANLNDLAPDGTSVLEVAIANANYELAAMLLERGANPKVSENGWTPLHRLARARRPNYGYMPGAVATGSFSSLELAKQLIAHGADVNARQTKPVDDSYRQSMRIDATPFWLAAKYVDAELMRVLVEHGADPTLRIKNGTTALMAATGVGMLYLSEDTGTDEETLEAVRLCVVNGVDVNIANEDGETPLHGAARRGIAAVVDFLVDSGAKLDARTKKGLTPLGVAEGAQRGDIQPETAKRLRELMVARNVSIEEIDRELFDPLKRPGPVQQRDSSRPDVTEGNSTTPKPGGRPADAQRPDTPKR